MFAADRASWQNPRILAMLLLVFVSGALAGAVSMRARLQNRSARSAPSYLKDDRTGFSYDKLKRDLNLSAQQSERLKSILDDWGKYHEDLQAQMDDVRATGKNRIVQILEPKQRQRFEELCNQLSAQ